MYNASADELLIAILNLSKTSPSSKRLFSNKLKEYTISYFTYNVLVKVTFISLCFTARGLGLPKTNPQFWHEHAIGLTQMNWKEMSLTVKSFCVWQIVTELPDVSGAHIPFKHELNWLFVFLERYSNSLHPVLYWSCPPWTRLRHPAVIVRNVTNLIMTALHYIQAGFSVGYAIRLIRWRNWILIWRKINHASTKCWKFCSFEIY